MQTNGFATNSFATNSLVINGLATNTASGYASMLTAIFGSFEHPMLLQPVDLVQPDEDDEVMDSWLASLGPREFELILSDLASDSLDGRFALEPTA